MDKSHILSASLGIALGVTGPMIAEYLKPHGYEDMPHTHHIFVSEPNQVAAHIASIVGV